MRAINAKMATKIIVAGIIKGADGLNRLWVRESLSMVTDKALISANLCGSDRYMLLNLIS